MSRVMDAQAYKKQGAFVRVSTEGGCRHRPDSGRARRAAAAVTLLVLCLGPSSVSANGPPVVPPATAAKVEANGVFVDWWRVLANPDNVVWDELGSAVACPTQDADCSSMARHEDLRRFAWTYGLANLSVRIDRQAKAPGDSDYFLYIDADDDGLMETGERVFRFTWGAGRDVRVNLLVYNAAAPAGDAMPSGDGAALPGSVALIGGPGGVLCTRCASVDGTSVELSLPWLSLGAASSRSFAYHLSSMGSLTGATAGPSNARDNLGGRAATLALRVEPELESVAVRGGSAVEIEFLITQLGSVKPETAEPINLRVVSELGLPIEIWLVGGGRLALDANGDGDFLDGGDSVDSDLDGDGLPDASGDEIRIYLRTEATPASGSVDHLQVLASPSRLPERVERGSCALHSGPLTLTSASASAAPAGTSASHAHLLNNFSDTPLTVQFLFESAWASGVYEDDGRGNPGLPFGGDEVLLGANSSLTVHVVVDVPAGAQEGLSAELTRVTAQALGTSLEDSPSVLDRTEAQASLDILNRHAAGALRGLGAALPGGRLHAAHGLVNGGNQEAPVFLSALAFGGPVSSPILFTDPNGDGNPSDGELLDVFMPVLVAGNGGRFDFVVTSLVDASSAVGEDITVGVIAFDDRDGTEVSVFDDSRTRSGITTGLASHEVAITAFAACDTVFASFGTATAGSQSSSAWSGPDGAPLAGEDLWADGLGESRTRRRVDADMQQGSWTATSGMQSADFRVERSVSLSLGAPRLLEGDSQLQVRATLQNDQSLATLSGARLELSVLTAGANPGVPGGFLLVSEGATAALSPHDGTRSTLERPLAALKAGRRDEVLMTVRAISWGVQEDFAVHVRLLDACGGVLAEGLESFSLEGGALGPVDVLRNASLATLAMPLLPAVLDAAGAPEGPTRLDAVADLEAADVGPGGSYRVTDDAIPVGPGLPGVLIFYEVTDFLGPLRVAVDGGDVVLSGW